MLSPAASRAPKICIVPASRRALNERGRLVQAMHLMGARMSFARDREIYGENDPAEYVYCVIRGNVRACKFFKKNDGRRQIGGFYLPGDIFGIEFTDVHAFTAEAITDSKVVMVSRRALASLADRDAMVAHELLVVTSRELRRAQDHLVLLIKSAQERLASFLLEMAERCGNEDVVELPMSRIDIGDYLGLSFETVSRMLSGLEDAAAIEMPTTRRIVLRDRSILGRLSS